MHTKTSRWECGGEPCQYFSLQSRGARPGQDIRLGWFAWNCVPPHGCSERACPPIPGAKGPTCPDHGIWLPIATIVANRTYSLAAKADSKAMTTPSINPPGVHWPTPPFFKLAMPSAPGGSRGKPNTRLRSTDEQQRPDSCRVYKAYKLLFLDRQIRRSPNYGRLGGCVA